LAGGNGVHRNSSAGAPPGLKAAASESFLYPPRGKDASRPRGGQRENGWRAAAFFLDPRKPINYGRFDVSSFPISVKTY
jgi:hypothetical protein